MDQTLVFGHDGHGSVRVLYDLAGPVGQIVQALTFAAGGQTLAVHGQPGAIQTSPFVLLTPLGYSGEFFDAAARQQYLRARFYNPANGRFHTFDRFNALPLFPIHLHKYAYAGGDPILYSDPTGFDFTVGAQLANVSISASVDSDYNNAVLAAEAQVAKEIPFFVVQQTARHAAVSSGSSGLLGGLIYTILAPVLGVALMNQLTQQQQRQQQHANGGSDTGTIPPGGGPDGGGSRSSCATGFSALPLDSLERATGASAIIGPLSINQPRTDFTGWPGWWWQLPRDHGQRWRRGHLIASSLGGSGGTDYRNMAAIREYTNNAFGNRGMRGFEHSALRAAARGDCILAFVTPVHFAKNYYPTLIIIEAVGTKGYSFTDIIIDRDSPNVF